MSTFEAPTQAQVHYIKDLIAKRSPHNPTVIACTALIDAPIELFNKKTASEMINELLKVKTEPLKFVSVSEGIKDLETGIYDIKPHLPAITAQGTLQNAKYAIVHNAKDGSKVKAKVLVKKWDNASGYGLKNIWSGTVVKALQENSGAKVDSATMIGELGKQFNFCMCCGKMLTDPVSVADGLGPVCKAKYFHN